MPSDIAGVTVRPPRDWRRLGWRLLAGLAVAGLVCLGIANMAARASWNEAEDGVLWTAGPGGVTAAEIAAGTPASRSGLRPGDVLLAIDGQPIDTPEDVVAALHRSSPGVRHRYTLARLGTGEVVEVRLARVPQGNRGLYFVLATVGIFTLLVGGLVRLRRPSDQATLHFFWLSVAFFGTFTLSPSGRFDRLDWVYFWGDAAAQLLLPPLFLHFTLAFPERPRSWARHAPRAALVLLYAPAVLLGGARVFAVAATSIDPRVFIDILEVVDRVELLYLSLCLVGGLAALVFALQRAHSVTVRRQLRWIVWGTGLGGAPFAVGYGVPFALGLTPSLAMELFAIPLSLVPLAFACAIVRYRLMDVEVIVKRGLVYGAAVAAIIAMYAVLQQLAELAFLRDPTQHSSVIAVLATLVVVLLARPVKDWIQNALDRLFYRDRYDYRRALVAFARDLNADLDLNRLTERLVGRIVETLLVDRMALLLRHEEVSGAFTSVRASGFAEPVPDVAAGSSIGRLLDAGYTIALDDPIAARRVDVEEVERWRDCGVHYFVPCVSKEATIAALAIGRKEGGEPLSSEDLALLAAVAGQVATSLENGRLYTRLRRQATEVEAMRQFNENILESLSAGLMVLDQEDRIIRWNAALERMRGIPRGEALGRPAGDVFEPAFVDGLASARGTAPGGTTLYRVPLARATGEGSREAGGRSGDGSSGDGPAAALVNVTIVPLRDGSRGTESAGTIVILDDVSARVKLEEQLQIAEKMASIGFLAAGVAHEVNTPLTGISSYTQMLLRDADPGDPRTELLRRIESQTFRAARIVNGLLNLSRQSAAASTERTRVDVNTVVNDVLALLEHQLRSGNIQVRRELAAQEPIVLGVEHKLQQVFLNLILNARDAMPKGGWLSVATRVDGGQVIATVADTGSGIPNEHLSRIYDPFFTTKAIGRGTGLGLSIAYGIVQEHDGTLSCESTLGEGTRFTVALPLAPARDTSVAAS